ncbi:MAG: acylase, partial [Bacteroidia bacterium]|nr:acylase [Bacteroidia bacterium]
SNIKMKSPLPKDSGLLSFLSRKNLKVENGNKYPVNFTRFLCMLNRFIVLLLGFQFGLYLFAQTPSVTIVRDTYGVPHILGKTDADVAYGLAWATCEDNFRDLQLNLLSAKGRLGEVEGKTGAIFDFFYHLTEVRKTVTERYEKELSPSFRAYIESYVAGVNRYAEKHPEEVLVKNLFPATGQDVICAYTLNSCLFSMLPFAVQAALEGRLETYEPGFNGGSNAIAVSSSRTSDGKSYLAINSHQPLEGRYSWYEVHLQSEEGLNILGGTFPGGITIFHGTNEYLGWAHTFNWPDFVDYYQLKMNPKSKEEYELDGKWYPLRKQKIKLRVKVGGIIIPVTRELLWSEHGPVIKTDKGYFAFRTPALTEIRTAEQWYRMNKATSLNEFRNALEMNAAQLFNTIYADRQGNIFYISNGKYPVREATVKWDSILDGSRSDLIWKEIHPISRVPQLLNPASGYLFNTNNTPLNATAPEDNLKPHQVEPSFDIQVYDNNRSRRMTDLFNELRGKKISWDDFKRIKYDIAYPKHGAFYESIKPFFELNPEKYPQLKPIIQQIQGFDFEADTNDRKAPALLLALTYVFKKIKGGTKQLEEGLPYNEALFVEGLTFAQKHLLKHYKTVDVRLGDLQKLIRADKRLAISGMPDVIAAIISVPYQKTGLLKADVGESYIMMVRYSENRVEIETVHAYGASSKPNSPHYTDQMELFVKRQLKPMSLSKSLNLQNAKRQYQPE